MSEDLNYIAADLRTLAVPIDTLHEDPANARTKHAVERIAASLRQYGQRKPLVVNRLQGNKVEAGNGGLQAARLLGWRYVAAVFVDDDPATAAGFGIADNRVGEFSEWDLDVLAELGTVTGDLFTGFEPAELDELFGADEATPSAEPVKSGYKEQYGVIVICASEEEQEQVYNQLLEQGYNCRVVVT